MSRTPTGDGATFRGLLEEDACAEVTAGALAHLREPSAAGPGATGAEMARRVEEGTGEPETVLLQVSILAADLLDAIGRLGWPPTLDDRIVVTERVGVKMKGSDREKAKGALLQCSAPRFSAASPTLSASVMFLPAAARHRILAGMVWKPGRRVTQRDGVSEASRALVPFVDDDDGYLRWLAAHPEGYVLNMERSPRPSYLPLHRATCKHISGTHGKSQTGLYTKLCSGDRRALEDWARADVGGTPKPCGQCKP